MENKLTYQGGTLVGGGEWKVKGELQLVQAGSNCSYQSGLTTVSLIGDKNQTYTSFDASQGLS